MTVAIAIVLIVRDDRKQVSMAAPKIGEDS
jgi:hypothetical protein